MENADKEDMPEDAERQGLGTPATRAAMIEKLLSAGFVERKGKSLVPTKDGINLAVILPDMLKSPLLTAEWETRLTEIAKGSDDPQSFMQGIEDMKRELLKLYSHITENEKKLFAPEKEAAPPVMIKKIGKTTYRVKIHFSETSKETMSDKIKRLILNDSEKSS